LSFKKKKKQKRQSGGFHIYGCKTQFPVTGFLCLGLSWALMCKLDQFDTIILEKIMIRTTFFIRI